MLRIIELLNNKDALNEILQEFKQRGTSDTLFYILFIIRRIILSILIVMVNEPVLQLTISIVISLSVSFK